MPQIVVIDIFGLLKAFNTPLEMRKEKILFRRLLGDVFFQYSIRDAPGLLSLSAYFQENPFNTPLEMPTRVTAVVPPAADAFNTPLEMPPSRP